MSESDRPKHHYIPAVVLGGFSSDLDRERRRDRRLHVMARGGIAPEMRTAKSVGHVRGLYDWRDEGPIAGMPVQALDDSFQAYERRLSDAFDIIDECSGWLPFEPWIRTLVPYVSGLTVRSPHFLGSTAQDPNLMIQGSRWMELSRNIAPLMAADWYLDIAPRGARFIINDRGYTWLQIPPSERLGMLVPLTPRHALAIMPRAERVIAHQHSDGTWLTSLPPLGLSAEAVSSLNRALACAAIEWFAGVEAADVADLPFCDAAVDAGAFAGVWPARGRIGTHDQDWHTALRLAGLPLNESDWQPLTILSAIESGVRAVRTAQGPGIEISFLKPQHDDRSDVAVVFPASEGGPE